MTEQETDDPLDGAAIGETRTVRESKTLSGINFEPLIFYGSDRQGRPRIVDLEVVTDDHDDDVDDIRITWEADMTKRLPRRWDECNEPRTAREESVARRKRWIGRIGSALALILPIALGTYIAGGVVTSNELTINGEPVAITWAELVPAVLLIFALAALIMYGVRGGFPGMAGGRSVR